MSCRSQTGNASLGKIPQAFSHTRNGPGGKLSRGIGGGINKKGQCSGRVEGWAIAWEKWEGYTGRGVVQSHEGEN